MKSYAQAREKDHTNAEIMGQKRQEKALREFKQVLEDLVFLLRQSSDMQTVYLYWVNRSREQFVLETKSTTLSNVMFQDRVNFANHYLQSFKDISEPVEITVGEDLQPQELSHYYEQVPIQHMTLLPFRNNDQTVAITVLESGEHGITEEKSDVIYSYIEALRNVLNTYLEISDLYERQEEWVEYEQSLERLDSRGHRAEIIQRMINEMQQHLPQGSVSFIAKGMNRWSNVCNSRGSHNALPVGMPLEERSLAQEALQKGEPEFSIHFNNNPKRLSPREPQTEGATLAIPLMFDDRRQGLVLAYDKNPLVFKESTKHKLINYVRTASLLIQSRNPSLELDEPFLVNEYGGFLPDIWERVVDNEISSLKQGARDRFTWLGLVTLDNLSELRTRMRLEDLQHMQRDLIQRFNPSRFGIPGIIGSHADYVYTFLIQSRDPKAVEQWTKALKKDLEGPIELSNGAELETSIKVGFTKLDETKEDSYQVLSNAKSALSQAMKKRAQNTDSAE